MSRRRKFNDTWFWLGVFPVGLVVGGILILASAWGVDRDVATINDSEAAAVATVISVHANSGRRSTFYVPTVEFPTSDGTVTADLPGTNDDVYREGSEVTVHYSSSDPTLVYDERRPLESRSRWIGGSIVLTIGAATTALGIWVFRMWLSERRAK